MIRNILKISLTGIIIIGIILFFNYWIHTQPIWVHKNRKIDERILSQTPLKNKQIIGFIEAHGSELARTYEESVCTEFVIKVIDQFGELSADEKNIIRIITTDKLDSLIQIESPVVKGVQTALIKAHKGIEINNYDEVRPGDFVQFWNSYQNKQYGHCGVVLEVNPNESLVVYSSHPVTDGYGKQKFSWPEKIFFVRLQ